MLHIQQWNYVPYSLTLLYHPHRGRRLATRLSAALATTAANSPVHDTVMDSAPQETPTAPPGATSMPMEVDKAPAPPSGQDVVTDTSAIYFDKMP